MKTNDKLPSRNIDNFNENKENKESGFFKRHWFVISLLAVIVIIILWALIKVEIIQKRSVTEKEQLVALYVNKMDSLMLSNMELTTKVFSWAIRSEMTRQNMEQVNQFFSSFVKEPNISKIQLIDPVTAKVLLSSDKKDEGTIIENQQILQAERIIQLSDETGDKIVSPVMGLDTRIGVLVIELEKIHYE